MCRLRRCSYTFHSQAKIVKWTVRVASRVLDGASNESGIGCKSDCFRHDFRRVAEPFFQIRGDRQICRIHDQARVRKRVVSRQLAISSTKSRGGCRARCGQCLKAKAGENAG
jgi:hypothetical protein